VINENFPNGGARVFDPFAGSATTLVAAEQVGATAVGLEPHPFISRVAAAKLDWRSDREKFLKKIQLIDSIAKRLRPSLDQYPSLVRRCFDDTQLSKLDRWRRACERTSDETAATRLSWLALMSVLRKTSSAGTAQWQYILPKKQKAKIVSFEDAWAAAVGVIHSDMGRSESVIGPKAQLFAADARTWAGDQKFNFVITSPPYPNNYDYADATRLEMSFLGEVSGWGDLQETVRKFLLRSCSQHVPESAINMDSILEAPALSAIREDLRAKCEELKSIRETKGGRKTYHLMAACYFQDLANVWKTLRRVCEEPSKVCFVIGDSAPYGVYLPVIPWLGRLALAAGFKSFRFEKTRDRNIKWKNRKHRVPLQEGRLWVEG